MDNACGPVTGRRSGLTCVSGQVVLEFTFTIFIVFLFVYALIKVFAWSGITLAERAQVHQKALTQPISEGYADPAQGPLKQVDPYFYKPHKIRAVWGE